MCVTVCVLVALFIPLLWLAGLPLLLGNTPQDLVSLYGPHALLGHPLAGSPAEHLGGALPGLPGLPAHLGPLTALHAGHGGHGAPPRPWSHENRDQPSPSPGSDAGETTGNCVALSWRGGKDA